MMHLVQVLNTNVLRHWLSHSRPISRQYQAGLCPSGVVVVDVNNLKNGRNPVKLHKESPAGCAGEGKQDKGN